MPESDTLPTTPIPGELVRADQLVIGDILLKDDGSFLSIVEDCFTDHDGTWVDDGNEMGYVGSHQKYRIESFYAL